MFVCWNQGLGAKVHRLSGCLASFDAIPSSVLPKVVATNRLDMFHHSYIILLWLRIR